MSEPLHASAAFHLLLTRTLSAAGAEQAGLAGIVAEGIPFIETVDIQDEDTKRRVRECLALPATALFTSPRAVDAIRKIWEEERTQEAHASVPGWKIFSMGGQTAGTLRQWLGDAAIIGTASDATRLATEMLEYFQNAPSGSIPELCFFCGSLRLDTLPRILQHAGIPFRELPVYETRLRPVKLTKLYAAIAFFSPSAVESFFMQNNIDERTACLAIGETTAAALKKRTNAPLYIADYPSEEAIIRLAEQLAQRQFNTHGTHNR